MANYGEIIYCKDCDWHRPLPGSQIAVAVCNCPDLKERVIGMYAMVHGFITDPHFYCGFGKYKGVRKDDDI